MAIFCHAKNDVDSEAVFQRKAEWPHPKSITHPGTTFCSIIHKVLLRSKSTVQAAETILFWYFCIWLMMNFLNSVLGRFHLAATL
jgi:hypothetical protein